MAGQSRQMSYGYDSFGNMTQVPGATPLAASLDYDANNRYLRGSPALEANFSCVGVNGEAGYDAAGNLACWGTPGIYAQAWTWDAESRQTRQYYQQNNNTYVLRSRNTYDANGQRVRADHFTPSGTNDSFREYSFFNGEMLTEKDQRGYWTDYVYAFGRKIGRIDPFNIAFWTTGDQVGTTQLEFDRNATLTYRGEFMPFGQELSTGPTTNRFKFTGKERDPESGLDYFGARYYSSGLGRWMSPDLVLISRELGNPQSWNKYSYTFNNPLKLIDPDGKWPTPTHHQINRDVFLSKVGEHGLKVINDASDRSDNIFHGGQNAARSREHAMSNGNSLYGTGMTSEKRTAAYNDTYNFIFGQIDQAVRSQLAYEHKGGKGYSDDALTHFGYAIHAVEDGTSPQHVGEQPWYGFSDMATDYRHVQEEERSALGQTPRDQEALYQGRVQAAGYWQYLLQRLQMERMKNQK